MSTVANAKDSANNDLHGSSSFNESKFTVGSNYVQGKIQNHRTSASQTLDISGFAIGHDDSFSLRAFLFDFSSSGSLVNLTLSDCSLGDRNAALLFDALKFHPSLKQMNLKGNGLTSSCCDSIGAFLHENATLNTLILCWNELGINEALFPRFTVGLMINQALENLDLRSNRLNSECASRLAEALAENRHLSSLDLRWNAGIGCSGGQAFLKIITKLGSNSIMSINSLRLEGCNVTPDILNIISGWIALIEEQQRSVDREQKAFRAISQHVETASSAYEEKIKLLNHALQQKEAEAKLAENRWIEQLETLNRELIETRGSLVSASSRISTLESELLLERHRADDVKMRMEEAIQTAKQLNSRALQAEAKLTASTTDLERRWASEKSQLEHKTNDLCKELERTKYSLEESRMQRNDLEERVAKLAAEKANAEMELANARGNAELALVRERAGFQERLDMLEKRWRDAISSSDNDRFLAEKQHSQALRDATDELSRLQRSIRDLSQTLSSTQHDLTIAREEAEAAKIRADKATKEASIVISEFETLRTQAERASTAEKKSSERVRDLERQVDRLTVENTENRRKLEKFYEKLHATQMMARQLHHPLQECLDLAEKTAGE